MEIEPEHVMELDQVKRFQIEQARPIRWRQKVDLIYQHQDVKKLPGVGYRIVANSLVLIPDSLPSYFGIPAPFVADGLKWFRWLCQFHGVDPKALDLTPDVDKFTATGSSVLLEPIQFMTHAPIPSHALETAIQLVHDLNKIKRAWRSVKRIGSIQTVADLRKYQVDQVVKTLQPPIPTYPLFPPDATPEEIVTKYIPRPDV